ncbi:MAG: DUF456 domain-containing protein [Herpetosiphon sp.]|nr:DUF456 domain-containing protein [Herpetosiphon sp.]
MTPELILALMIMVVGVAASMVPMMPGSLIVWLGAFFYAWSTKFQIVGWLTLVILGLMAIAASTSDLWVGTMRQRQAGASLASTLGGLIGGIIGLFVFALPGMLLGTIIGTLVPDWKRWRDWRHISHISWRTVKNWMVGIAVQVGIGIAMIIVFVVRVSMAS